MNEYLKNVLFLLCGAGAACAGGLIARGDDRYLNLVLDLALLCGLILAARAVGRMIVLFGMQLRLRKKKDITNVERSHQVRSKAIRNTWCVILCLFAALWLHPEFANYASNLLLIPLLVFLWQIVYLPFWLYLDKHYTMELKRPNLK